MKLYALFALAVSVAAIRVQTNSKTQMKADLKNKMHEALKKIETSNLMKQPTEQDFYNWLREEAASVDGLTWPEMKDLITKFYSEYSNVPT